MAEQLSNRISQKLITHLAIGSHYVLQDIADLMEMNIVATMRKGVLSRTGEDAIVLLINLKKESYATPYVDHIDNDVLYWEGQLKQRFVEKRMNTGEYEIFVFVRDRVKTPYTYYGRAIPISSQYFEPGTPCKTKFSLYEYTPPFRYYDKEHSFDQEQPYGFDQGIIPTTRIGTTIQRTVQQTYRRQALELWNNSCAVLGIEEPKILVASHIKPWRVADDHERIDPKNALILSPLYDKLFDLGMISFDPSKGTIKLSKQLDNNEYDRLGVDDTKHLSMIPDGTEKYLNYHNKYVYDFSPLLETELDLLTH
nr:HNH endonuclease signature motif containing protein [uncultured Sphaerochaeta sp.]